MPKAPDVAVRDKQTGHEYMVSEARFRRTPELWDRLMTKPRTTVDREAARKARLEAAGEVPDPADALETTEPTGSPEDVHPNPGDEAGHTSGHQAESSEEEI